MTQPEFETFIKSVYIAFPGLRQWLTENSPDPPKTIASWSQALERVTASEASTVLSGWVSGDIPDPPTGWRREQFALDVRAIVQRRRDEGNRERQRDEIFKKANSGKYRSPIRSHPVLGPSMDKIFEAVAKRNDGSISQEDLDAQLKTIVDDGCIAIDDNKPKPAHSPCASDFGGFK